MDAAHQSFNVLQGVKRTTQKEIIFISEITPDRSRLYQWMPNKFLKQVFYQSLKALDMTVEVLKAKRCDAIFIFEHKPQYSFLLYLACLIKAKPTFFIVHGLQQIHNRSIAHYAGFKLIKFLVKYADFWPIHLELSDKGVKGVQSFTKSIVIPIVIPEEIDKPEKFISSEIKIGIVGMIRPDKPLVPIANKLIGYVSKKPNLKFYVGTPFWQLTDEVKNLPVLLIDTSSKEQYANFIKSLDIVIADFERDSYYFRPSAIISDALAGGCYVIAPDFPIFNAQVNNPVKVGELYNDLNDIENSLDKALHYVRTRDVDFHSWRRFRSTDRIIKNLSNQMIQIIEKK